MINENSQLLNYENVLRTFIDKIKNSELCGLLSRNSSVIMALTHT